MAAGVNKLNPFSLDAQNKYGRRAQHFKPNLNILFFKMAVSAPFINFLNLNLNLALFLN
jgi:hypothetical protein